MLIKVRLNWIHMGNQRERWYLWGWGNFWLRKWWEDEERKRKEREERVTEEQRWTSIWDGLRLWPLHGASCCWWVSCAVASAPNPDATVAISSPATAAAPVTAVAMPVFDFFFPYFFIGRIYIIQLLGRLYIAYKFCRDFFVCLFNCLSDYRRVSCSISIFL